MFRREVLCFSLCSLSLGLSHGTMEKSVFLLFSPSLQVFLYTDELPCASPCPGWSPRFLSLSSERRCSRSLIPFEALCWTCFTMSTFLIVGSPALLMCPHQCRREGNDHPPECAGNTCPNTAQSLIFTSVHAVTEGLLAPWGKHKGTKILQMKQVKRVTFCLYEEPCISWCLTYSSTFWLKICTWIRHGPIIPFGKLCASVKMSNTPG